MTMRTRFVLLVCVMLAGSVPVVFSAGLERTAETGGVMGSTKPLNLADPNASTISFEVALNTHTFPLNFDMAKIARLSDGKKLSEPATAWSGGKGGHHLSGTLSFPAASLKSAEEIILTLSGAGGGKDLTFVWKAPF